MKKVLIFFAVAAIALVGCEDKTYCVTTDYTIVNQIESDIVIELKFGDGQEITIKSGETKMFYTGVQCSKEGFENIMTPEVLMHTEMRINGEVVSRYIWWYDYWVVEPGKDGDNYKLYTLTVTDELLEAVNNRQNTI